MDGLGDVIDSTQHFDGGDLLAVSVAQRVCDAGAAGGERRECEALEDARAGYVPSIGEQENIWAIVKRAEFVSFLLLRDGHSGVTSELRVRLRVTILG